MTNSVPKAFALSPAPVTGDFINHDGATVTISNVSSADNGQGFIEYTLTLSDGAIVVVTYANCVLSSQAPLSVAGARINPNTWVQSKDA